MKKTLFFVLLLMPFLMMAQPVTQELIFENFDLSNDPADYKFRNSPNLWYWKTVTDVASSQPRSMNAKMNQGTGDMYLISDTIEIPNGHNFVYLNFDQICKIVSDQVALIQYQVATGYTPEGHPIFGQDWHNMIFSSSTPTIYYGKIHEDGRQERGAVPNTGRFSVDAYQPLWGSALNDPTNNMWRNELLNITSFVINSSSNIKHFRIRFLAKHNNIPQFAGVPGWYLDNIKVVSSPVELIPPQITWDRSTPMNTVNNKPGPHAIIAQITDNTGVDYSSVRFWYTIDGGTPVYLPNDSILPGGTATSVKMLWWVPRQCYGTDIRYGVEAKDIHGNSSRKDTVLYLRETYPANIGQNDAELTKFIDFPSDNSVTAGDSYPITVAFTNKSRNTMETLQIGWKNITTNESGSYTWDYDDKGPRPDTHGLCMDLPDTVIVGNFTPTMGSNLLRVWVINRNNAEDDRHNNDTLEIRLYGCRGRYHGPHILGTGDIEPSEVIEFADLSEMKERFHYCGMDGDVVIRLLPGDYTDFQFTSNDPSIYGHNVSEGGNDRFKITFESYNGIADSVRIVDNTSTGEGAVVIHSIATKPVKNYGFHNITLLGKTGGASSRGVFIHGNKVENVTISNCKIKIEDSQAVTPNFAGICRTLPSSNNQGDDRIWILNNTITGGSYGIYYFSNSSRTHHVNNISGNTITSRVTGIYTKYSNVDSVYSNTVFQSTFQPTPFNGIHIENSSNAKFYAKNKVYIEHDMKYGMYFNVTAGTAAQKLLIANNEVIGTVKNPKMYGIYIDNNAYTDLINNSVYVTSNGIPVELGASGDVLSALNLTLTSTNTVRVQNNILVNKCITSLSNRNYAIYGHNVLPSGRYTSNYNNYVSNGPLAYLNGRDRNLLQDIQALTLGTYSLDSNSISRDPDFPNLGNAIPNLKLNEYSGLEAKTFPRVLDDIEGTPRLSNITYMGAYTSNMLATNLEIVRLISPSNDVVCPQQDYPVQIEIRNVGSSNINFSQTNVTLNFDISHGIQIPPYQITGNTSVAPLSSYIVTLGSNVAIPLNENVDFTVSVNTPADTDHSNDTLRQTVRIEGVRVPYEEDFTRNPPEPAFRIQQIQGDGNWEFAQGPGTQPNIAPYYGSGRLFFNSVDALSTTETKSVAILPTIDLSNTTDPVFEMWVSHDNGLSNRTAEGYTVVLYTSTGASQEITAIGQSAPFIRRYDPTARTPVWKKYTYRLSSYLSGDRSCIQIGIIGTIQKGQNLNVDRVLLKDSYTNDLAVTDIYSLGKTSSLHQISPKIQARVINEGWDPQSNREVKLTITRNNAQVYTESKYTGTIPYEGEQLITFDGTHLTQNGEYLITIAVVNDENNANNSNTRTLIVTNDTAAYATNDYNDLLAAGSTAAISLVNRYKIDEELIVKAVSFYPVNAAVAEGKPVIAFVSDSAGNVLATSDTLVITSEMVNTWVTIPINNYARTNLARQFYAGIHMLEAGYYLGTQVEGPIRDSAYYSKVNNNYVPQTTGRFMINAVVDKPITKELAILDLVNPVTNCDLGNEEIKIAVTNNGYEEIPAGTVFHYSVNGTLVETYTYDQSIPSRGANPNYIVFNNTYNFTNNVVGQDDDYVIKVWATNVTGDLILFNDTIKVEIISKGKSNYPIAADEVQIPFYTSDYLTATLPPSIPQGELLWYANTGIESWDFLHMGSSFLTPTIYYDTTFYVTAAPGTVRMASVENSSTQTFTLTQPFLFNTGYSRGRVLYEQSEIGRYGTISKMALNVNNTTNVETPIKIYLKETDLATLPSAPFNWETEIADAVLVYEGTPAFNTAGWFELEFSELFEYTSGNLMVLTETNCGTPCVSNTTTPNFKGNSITLHVQYVNWNQNTNPQANWQTYSRRWDIQLFMADLECASEKKPVAVKVVNQPTYDVETEELVYPVSSCALGEEYIEVRLRNRINRPIPAGKIMIKAVFNGNTITHLVNEAFGPLEVKVVRFTTPFDFTADVQQIDWNYTISTDIPELSYVYRLNDTIRGTVTARQTDPVPEVIYYTGEFTRPFTVIPDNTHRTFKFYDSPTAITPFYTAPPAYTTPRLYDTLVLWVSAISNTTSSNCETKRMKIQINVQVSDFDLTANHLISPVSLDCGLMDEFITMEIGNTMDTIIPANKFRITGEFTGTSTRTVIDTIKQAIGEYDTLDYTFNNSVLLGSAIQNNIYNYKIFLDNIDPMITYRGNDTITGTIKIPATPNTPPALEETIPYGMPYTITPTGASPLNYFYFYDPSTGELEGEGSAFTTPRIYDPVTVYDYSGRISENEFAQEVTVGNPASTSNTTLPFTFSQGQSVGVILYTAAEMGGHSGTIDTIAIQINKKASDGFPVKIYLKNDNRASLSGGNYTWSAFTNGATLIFDDLTDFAPNDGSWFKIPVPGGFEYTGESLLILTQHDCGNASCANSLGINPTPEFRWSNTTPVTKVISSASNSPIVSANFSGTTSRINTKFHINYACVSPKSTFTLRTTIPNCDLELLSIESPVTPNNNYGNNETVKVKIKNHGSTAASGFAVGYYLEGEAATEESFRGSIPAGGTGEHTFTTGIDLTGIYFANNFYAYVRQECDIHRFNDTLGMVLEHDDPCFSRAWDATGADISNFTFSNINNGPGTPIFGYNVAPNDGMYTDYTQTVPPAIVVVDQFYSFSITNSFTTQNGTPLYKYIYIDFNRDNQFSANELVFSTPTAIPAPTPANPASAVTTGRIDIPLNASLGLTRMRVITSQTSLTSPCVLYQYGETEDYAVQISPALPHDLGITAILHPSGSICADQEGRIKVTVKNYGTSTEDFSESNSLLITATVSGVGNNTYTTTITSGSLQPREEMIVIIEGVDYSQIGEYNTHIVLQYLSDQYSFNNEFNATAKVESNAIASVPVSENFENMAEGTSFSADWKMESTTSNYQWAVQQGGTNRIPANDHSIGIPPWGIVPEGKYAVVKPATSANPNAITTLTSQCVDLHYHNQYPKQVDYWEHIYAANANTQNKLYVQIGSGDNYITVDSITGRTNTSTAPPWYKRTVVLDDFDEVAKVRFLATGQNGTIYTAIDDIAIDFGKPDIGIEAIVYPSEDPADCLVREDSVTMTVRIKNYGLVSVYDYQVTGSSSSGSFFFSKTEDITQPLHPGETMEYTFTAKFPTPGEIYSLCQFGASTSIEHDSDPENDIKTVITCLTIGIEENLTDNGVILGQNIPNPASARTRIPFSIPKEGEVIINIHSIEGQLLESYTGYYDQGEHMININTRNLAAGIYLYNLQYGDVSLTKKMIIQK